MAQADQAKMLMRHAWPRVHIESESRAREHRPPSIPSKPAASFQSLPYPGELIAIGRYRRAHRSGKDERLTDVMRGRAPPGMKTGRKTHGPVCHTTFLAIRRSQGDRRATG